MSAGLEPLLAQGRERSSIYRPPEFRTPDPTRPFLPEPLTQLYHTPWYARLEPAQRLRYNQLSGLRANEVIMLFEDGFTRRVVRRLPQRLRQAGEPLLADCMEQLLVEEARHHAMFRAFNRLCLAHGVRFTRLSRLEEGLLARLTGRPDRWPLLLWLILLLEEYSTALSRRLADPASDAIDPEYRRLHRLHLEDEQRHVVYDAAAIRWLMARLRPPLASLNARLFRLLLGEVLAPKRSAVAVVRQLVAEFPGLEKWESAMADSVRSLGLDPGMRAILDDPAALPVTRELLAAHPAFGWSR